VGSTVAIAFEVGGSLSVTGTIFYDVTTTSVCMHSFLTAIGRVVSKTCIRLLLEHVECRKLSACNWY